MPSRPVPKVRYAVVGLGYISQVAVLPAFKHARENSALAALVSGDATKLRKLGKKYGVRRLYSYEQYDELLKSGEIDAVYIALPNHMHADFALRAMRAGIHVLCEKPLEVNAERCQQMIDAARAGGLQLMTAYRLHLEKAHLTAIKLIRRGKIGEPKIFSSIFSITVDQRNYRAADHKLGGGPMYDLGIYCLNATRYLFGQEPVEVSALTFGSNREGKSDSEQSITVNLRYPNGEAASFVCSFDAYPVSELQISGTKGSIKIENAYEYVGDKILRLESKGKKTVQRFKQRDQFAAELSYFSERTLSRRPIEPSGEEGLADIRVIEAIFESARTGRVVRVGPSEEGELGRERPTPEQEISKPPIEEPGLVRTKSPSKKQAA